MSAPRTGPPPGPGGTKEARARSAASEWERITHEIERCRRCPLGATRAHVVVYRGSRTPRVVFVGEAPGAEEDRQGLPFVGRSGRVLDRAVESLGLEGDGWGVLNLIKCRPPKNRFDAAAAQACRPFLDRQLTLLGPRVVVTLGARALRALDPSAPPVLRAAGIVRTGRDPPLFPLIHPAASLRSRRWADRWTRDIEALGRWWNAEKASRF